MVARAATIFILIWIFLTLYSCESGKSRTSGGECKGVATFITNTGFDAAKSFFIPQFERRHGLVLVQSPNSENPQMYQHPTWRRFGNLGPLVIDQKGNIYTAPAPQISLDKNPPARANTVLIANEQTGALMPFFKLPDEPDYQAENPFGILGLGLNCEAGVLYISSVYGSTRYVEQGKVYALRLEDKTIIDSIVGLDAFGLGLDSQGERLFIGSARRSEIYTVTLNRDGTFKQFEDSRISFNGLGPRGDDKARMIKVGRADQMQIHGVEFHFNLISPDEKQEDVYHFRFNTKIGKWKQLHKKRS